MKRIEQRDNWLGQRMAAATDQELRELFEEIHNFRRTGILVGGKLRALEKDFSVKNAMEPRLFNNREEIASSEYLTL